MLGNCMRTSGPKLACAELSRVPDSGHDAGWLGCRVSEFAEYGGASMTGQEHTSQFADAVDNQVARLSKQHGHLSDSLTAIQAAIEARLRDDGLNYHLVKGRVKSSESVKGKLSKLGPEGSPKYPNGLDDLDDILGVRVITYIEPDIANVVSALTGQFRVLENTDKKAQQVNKGVLGYAAAI